MFIISLWNWLWSWYNKSGGNIPFHSACQPTQSLLVTRHKHHPCTFHHTQSLRSQQQTTFTQVLDTKSQQVEEIQSFPTICIQPVFTQSHPQLNHSWRSLRSSMCFCFLPTLCGIIHSSGRYRNLGRTTTENILRLPTGTLWCKSQIKSAPDIVDIKKLKLSWLLWEKYFNKVRLQQGNLRCLVFSFNALDPDI